MVSSKKFYLDFGSFVHLSAFSPCLFILNMRNISGCLPVSMRDFHVVCQSFLISSSASSSEFGSEMCREYYKPNYQNYEKVSLLVFIEGKDEQCSCISNHINGTTLKGHCKVIQQLKWQLLLIRQAQQPLSLSLHYFERATGTRDKNNCEETFSKDTLPNKVPCVQEGWLFRKNVFVEK